MEDLISVYVWKDGVIGADESILNAVIIYAVLLLILSIAWILKYFSKQRRRVRTKSLVLMYLLTPVFINFIGSLIEFRRNSQSSGLDIFLGDTKDIVIPISATIIPPILISLVIFLFMKKYHWSSKRNF